MCEHLEQSRGSGWVLCITCVVERFLAWYLCRLSPVKLPDGTPVVDIEIELRRSLASLSRETPLQSLVRFLHVVINKITSMVISPPIIDGQFGMFILKLVCFLPLNSSYFQWTWVMLVLKQSRTFRFACINLIISFLILTREIFCLSPTFNTSSLYLLLNLRLHHPPLVPLLASFRIPIMPPWPGNFISNPQKCSCTNA